MRLGFLVIGCIGVIALHVSCSSTTEEGVCAQLQVEIEQMEQSLLAGGEDVDAVLRAKMMQSYARFANACHDHEFTPEALFRRADLLRSAGKYQEAMTQLRDIHDNYANYDKRSVCAFLVGFIAEVELKDREQAKKTYEQVIEVHPDSEAAIWALQSLQNLESTY
ncbi:MAG: hypothetical protein CL828_02540 [Crocinitomicaceae bacterium]|nr:hypothetical protein [Crocinitomicaceae bacterium]